MPFLSICSSAKRQSPCHCTVGTVLQFDPNSSVIKIASKYPNATQNFFENKGKQVECVKLNGSIEIAPQLGISDMIVDLVSTGKTLKENNLEIVEKISDISSCLIVNRISLKTKSDEVGKIINLFEKEVL